MRSRSTTLFLDGADKLGVATQAPAAQHQGLQRLRALQLRLPARRQAQRRRELLAARRSRRAHGCTPTAASSGSRHETDARRGVEGRVLDGPLRQPGRRFRVRATSRRARRRRLCLAASPDCQRHRPALGAGRQNLTLHPGFRVMARFDEPVRGWRGALQSAYSDALESRRHHDGGPLRSPGRAGRNPARHRQRPRGREPAPSRTSPSSAGCSTTTGGGRDPLRPVRPAPHHLPDGAAGSRRGSDPDAPHGRDLLRGRREGSVPCPSSAWARWIPDRLRSLDLEHVPGQALECSSQHPLGTCRMGVAPQNSVVDPQGQTWDVQDLYVADGSILPTSLGVNPQLSIMSMAMRIAWHLRDKPLPS